MSKLSLSLFSCCNDLRDGGGIVIVDTTIERSEGLGGGAAIEKSDGIGGGVTGVVNQHGAVVLIMRMRGDFRNVGLRNDISQANPTKIRRVF